MDARSESFGEVDFSNFKRKVKFAYGLDLDAYKRPQMERRLRANMDRCGADTFQQYYSLMEKNKTLADEFLDRVTINVSELFRNPDQFEVLRTKVIPELLNKKPGGLSVWSAGCSYGAEAYTLATILDETAPAGRHSILATDIDDRMLVRGKNGVFQESEMRNVTSSRITKYFDKSDAGYTAKASLKKIIKFEKNDLLEGRFKTGFDLIVCRNVVIYFTDETKSTLYNRFVNSLRPGGYLFVGGTERIAEYSDIGLENSYPFFYRKLERH